MTTTPFFVASRIWEAIPVEFIRPESRIIADISWDESWLFVSAYKRLSKMTDMQNVDLAQRVHSQMEWVGEHSPSIIIGDLLTGSTAQDENQRLRVAIDNLADNGYLAAVMPRSFVDSQAGIKARKQLHKFCELLEMWELPANVFSQAIVIVAQKKKLERRPRLIRTVRSNQFQQTMVDSTEWGMESLCKLPIDFSQKQRAAHVVNEDDNVSKWLVAGYVVEVDDEADHGHITLWLDVQEGHETKVEVSPIMHGWMLEKDAEFLLNTPYPYSGEMKNFAPHPCSYMSNEELIFVPINYLSVAGVVDEIEDDHLRLWLEDSGHLAKFPEWQSISPRSYSYLEDNELMSEMINALHRKVYYSS